MFLTQRSVALTGSLAVLLSSATAAADHAPTLFSYQGRLTSVAGIPVTSPTAIRLTLFQGGTAEEAVSSGVLAYQEDQVATTDESGVFVVTVGAGTPVASSTLEPADLATGGTPLFLETRVEGETMLPRAQIVSAPYAVEAARVGGLSAAQLLAGNATVITHFRHGATLSWLSPDTVQVGAGALGFSDGKIRETSGPLVFDIGGSNGPLGLATGTELPDTWYYLYAVPDGGDDDSFTVVGAPESPDEVGSGGPAGYAIHRYLGSVRNDPSGDLRAFYRSGETVYWVSMFAWYQFSGRSETLDTWIAADVSAGVPETSSVLLSYLYYDGTSGCSLYYSVKPTFASVGRVSIIGDFGDGSVTNHARILTVDQTLYWYAELFVGSNGTCHSTNFQYEGYVEDLSLF